MILFIDLGTDIYPAIALAYEEGEDFVLLKPPRSRNDHLVSFRLMLNAYGTIGVFETISAFFAFFMVFKYYGFLISDLKGLS
jgi:sodium/potassium-transporting ATPase subunit alpha